MLFHLILLHFILPYPLLYLFRLKAKHLTAICISIIFVWSTSTPWVLCSDRPGKIHQGSSADQMSNCQHKGNWQNVRCSTLRCGSAAKLIKPWGFMQLQVRSNCRTPWYWSEACAGKLFGFAWDSFSFKPRVPGQFCFAQLSPLKQTPVACFEQTFGPIDCTFCRPHFHQTSVSFPSPSLPIMSGDVWKCQGQRGKASWRLWLWHLQAKSRIVFPVHSDCALWLLSNGLPSWVHGDPAEVPPSTGAVFNSLGRGAAWGLKDLLSAISNRQIIWSFGTICICTISYLA